MYWILSMLLIGIGQEPDLIRRSSLLDLPPARCEASDGTDFDYTSVELVEVDTLVINNHKYTLEREDLIIIEPDLSRQTRIPVDTLADDHADLDISTSFVRSEGEYYARWRETYIHRPYRFGYVRLEGAQAVAVCEGVEGYSLYR